MTTDTKHRRQVERYADQDADAQAAPKGWCVRASAMAAQGGRGREVKRRIERPGEASSGGSAVPCPRAGRSRHDRPPGGVARGAAAAPAPAAKPAAEHRCAPKPPGRAAHAEKEEQDRRHALGDAKVAKRRTQIAEEEAKIRAERDAIERTSAKRRNRASAPRTSRRHDEETKASRRGRKKRFGGEEERKAKTITAATPVRDTDPGSEDDDRRPRGRASAERRTSGRSPKAPRAGAPKQPAPHAVTG